MNARVSVLESTPDKLEEGLRTLREQVLPQARQLQGFQGLYVLVDRRSGKTIGISLWDSQQAMEASAAAADPLRAQTAQAAGAGTPTVELYEVAIQELTS